MAKGWAVALVAVCSALSFAGAEDGLMLRAASLRTAAPLVAWNEKSGLSNMLVARAARWKIKPPMKKRMDEEKKPQLRAEGSEESAVKPLGVPQKLGICQQVCVL